MKRYVLGFVMLIASVTPLLAQWTTEAVSPVSPGQDIYLEFDFSSVIRIRYWDQQQAKAVLTVEKDDRFPQPDFSISAENSGSTVRLYMGKKQFEDYWKKQRHDKDCNCYSSPRMEVEVWIPRGVKTEAKSISGDIETMYEGGELVLETISGDVDLKLPVNQGLTLKASTISGDIYSDLSFNYTDGGKGLHGMVGMDLNANLNDGGKLLKLKSISGDILLRKL